MPESLVNCFIQARTGSKRLPDKVLLNLCGKSAIQRCYERVMMCERINNVIVIIPDNEPEFAEYLCEVGIPFFKGDPDDLLTRYCQASEQFPCQNIVRITADCPLIDPAIIDDVIKTHLEHGNEFTTNAWLGLETYPDGMDVSVIRKKTLDKLNKTITNVIHREHVVTYIMEDSIPFKTEHIASEIDYSEYRLTLDHIEDYYVLRILSDILFIDYVTFYGENLDNFGLDMIIEKLDENPLLKKINSMHKRNEAIL